MTEAIKLANYSGNDVIIWTVVLIVGIIACVPVYNAVIKGSTERVRAVTQREQLFIEVVKSNTFAMTELTIHIKCEAERANRAEEMLLAKMVAMNKNVCDMGLLIGKTYAIVNCNKGV